MASNKKWLRAKRRIENKYPQYADILALPEELPVPELYPEDLAPTPYFTGRAELCATIKKTLKSKKSQNIYALNGIGGIGKSELAKQVAFQLQEEEKNSFPDGYLWVSLEAAPKESIWGVIADLFDLVNFAKITKPEDQLAILREILRAVEVLVIVDNADNAESLHKAYQALKGKTILITSRQPCGLQLIGKTDLEDLSAADSMNLYWKIYSSKSSADPGSKDEYAKLLEEIASRLSGHPLSIEIIASVAARYNWSPEYTLKQLQQRGIDVITLPEEDAQYKAERHRAIKKTFELALDQDLGKNIESKHRVRTLFSVYAAMCGEYFHFEEVLPVLASYLNLFEQQMQAVEKERMARGEKRNNPFMQFLNLDEDKEPEPLEEAIPDPDDTGVAAVQQLRMQPGSLRRILDDFVAAHLIKKVPERDRYRFHPLLREYAWDILPHYLSPNIWETVAGWTAHKAQKLSSDPGDQVQNFHFFITVCQERDLPEEFSTILFSITPYLQTHGMWALEAELLELAKTWLAKKEEYATRYAKSLQSLGDLRKREGRKDEARSLLVQAKELFLKNDDAYNIAWTDFWLSGLLYPANTTQQFLHILNKLRFATQTYIYDVVSAEMRALKGGIDRNLMPDFYWALVWVSFHFKVAGTIIPNTIWGLLDLIASQRYDMQFDHALKLLNWAEKLQDLDFNAEVKSGILQEKLNMQLTMGNIDAAEIIFAEYIESEEKLGRKRIDLASNYHTHGRIYLYKKQYKDAAIQALQALNAYEADLDKDETPTASSYYQLPLLCALLTPDAVSKKRLKDIINTLLQMLTRETHSSEVAFQQGLLAAYEILHGEDSQLPGYLEIFCGAVRYLEEIHNVDLRWLELLETPVQDKVGKTQFNQIRHQQAAPGISFTPPVSVFPVDLPEIIRSPKDERLMRLIPGGLCPLDKSDFNGVDNIWMPAYYLDSHPVTNGDYARFLAATNHEPPQSWVNGEAREEEADLPVTGISYKDALAYCEWAGKTLPHVFELKRAVLLKEGVELDAIGDSGLPIEKIEQALEDFYASVKGQSEKAPQEQFWAGLTPQDSSSSSPYRNKPSWRAGLPENITVAEFIGLKQGNGEDIKLLEELVELLSGSLWVTVPEKEQFLNGLGQPERVNIEGLARILLEEKQALLALDPALNPRVAELIKFRWKEWRVLACKRLGISPAENISEQEKHSFSSMNPFDYAPPFNRFFPKDFNIGFYLQHGLADEDKKAAMRFLQNLSTALCVDGQHKFMVLEQLGSDAPVDANLTKEMEWEQQEAQTEKHKFSQWLARLQKAWHEWKLLSEHLVKTCQEKGALFEHDTHIALLHPSEEKNPFHTLEAWDSFLDEKADIRQVLPEHPNTDFDEAHFLTLFAHSVSLKTEEKHRILIQIGELTQEQLNELITMLLEERKKFTNLPRRDWKQLEEVHANAFAAWKQLVSGLTGVKTEKFSEKPDDLSNPFHQITRWDESVSVEEKVDIRQILPEHPDIELNEELFLNLLSGSVSLMKEEKRRILKAMPRLTQEQIDQLIKILQEERLKFGGLDKVHWPQLRQLFEKHHSEWKELIDGLLNKQEESEKEAATAEDINRDDNDINLAGMDFSILESPPEEYKGSPIVNLDIRYALVPENIDIRRIIPPHPSIFFAEKPFLQLLGGSLSLEKDEKRRIIEAIPRLTQEHIDQLIRILLEEIEKFMALDKQHWPQLHGLCREHWNNWMDLLSKWFAKDFMPVEKDVREFSYLDGQLWHWTSSKHYRGKKQTIAGGTDITVQEGSKPEERFVVRQVSKEEKSANWGFRCCIPVFSQEDLKGLENVLDRTDTENLGTVEHGTTPISIEKNTAEVKENETGKEHPPVDILVITALKDERDELLKCQGIWPQWKKHKDQDGYPYHTQIFTHKDGSQFVVAAARPVKMKKTPTAILATGLARELKPRCLAMTGICAGNRKEVFLGDVIVADRVFEVDGGKLKAYIENKGDNTVRKEELLHDIQTYNLRPLWKQQAEDFPGDWISGISKKRPKSYPHQERWLLHKLHEYEESKNDDLAGMKKQAERVRECPDWDETVQRLIAQGLLEQAGLRLTAAGRKQVENAKLQKDKPLEPDRLQPKVHVGPIGTSERVQQDPQLFARLESLSYKTLGVEMEGAAIGIVAEIQNIPMIVVKAVSDYGDLDKDKQFRHYAAETSARFLIEFMKETDIIPTLKQA